MTGPMQQLEPPRKRYLLNPDKKSSARWISALNDGLAEEGMKGRRLQDGENSSQIHSFALGSEWSETPWQQQGYSPRFPKVDVFDDEEDFVWREPAEYRCVGSDQRLYSPAEFKERGGTCPLGYNVRQTFKANQTIFPNSEASVICEGHPVVPPEPFCPPKYKPALVDYNGAAFFGTKALHCARDTRFKGRLWCPDTFIITREPYPNIPFASEVVPEAPQATYDPFVYDRVGFLVNSPAMCVRSVSLPYTQCNQYRCKDPILKELENSIKHFAYYRLQRDPRYIKFDSVPTGRDIRWSPNSRFYPA